MILKFAGNTEVIAKIAPNEQGMKKIIYTVNLFN
jgi:hypothetical protein